MRFIHIYFPKYFILPTWLSVFYHIYGNYLSALSLPLLFIFNYLIVSSFFLSSSSSSLGEGLDCVISITRLTLSLSSFGLPEKSHEM